MATFCALPEIRPVPDIPGYFASRDGRIFSDIVRPPKHPQGLIEIKLQGGRSQHGYLTFTGPNRRAVYVHRAVALAWIGPEPEDCMVCHLDGDPAHNHADNLRWDTMVGNMADKASHGTLLYGEGHPSSKLSQSQVNEIRRAYTSRTGFHWGCVEFARRFGVSTTAISMAARGKQWRSV